MATSRGRRSHSSEREHGDDSTAPVCAFCPLIAISSSKPHSQKPTMRKETQNQQRRCASLTWGERIDHHDPAASFMDDWPPRKLGRQHPRQDINGGKEAGSKDEVRRAHKGTYTDVNARQRRQQTACEKRTKKTSTGRPSIPEINQSNHLIQSNRIRPSSSALPSS